MIKGAERNSAFLLYNKDLQLSIGFLNFFQFFLKVFLFPVTRALARTLYINGRKQTDDKHLENATKYIDKQIGLCYTFFAKKQHYEGA